MVACQRLSEEPKELSQNQISDQSDYDDASDSSSIQNDLEICPASESVGNFGNVVVKNSSDVHFGNKTFYQGPVTIKQFLYNSSHDTEFPKDNFRENPGLSTESVCSVTNSNNAIVNNGAQNGIPQQNDISHDNGIVSKCIFFSRKYLKFIIILTLLSIAVVTVGVIILEVTGNTVIRDSVEDSGVPDSDEQETAQPVPLPEDPDAPPVRSKKLRIISRGEWVAQPPVKPANKLKTPVPYVIILHTATENCSDQGTCVFRVRFIQSFHIDSQNWWDIAYNFLVGGDGYAYEGRGWTNEGANAFGYNAEAIGIAFIGTFNNVMPPARQISAAKKLIEMGVSKGYIAKNYKLFAHRQLSSTQSPGHLLYEDVKKWPHWANTPDNYDESSSSKSSLGTTKDYENGTVTLA